MSEIRENLGLIRKYCPTEDIQYAEGKLNPSDMSTRADCKLADMGPEVSTRLVLFSCLLLVQSGQYLVILTSVRFGSTPENTMKKYLISIKKLKNKKKM